jgi:Protein of unknown function (DUF3592)
MSSALLGLWILIGVLLFVIAGKSWMESYRFKANAVSLPGVVIGSSKASSSSSNTSSPIVRYTTPKGEQRDHSYSAPLAGADHWIGDKVNILYDSQSGETKMDDWSELYLWPSLIAFFAFIILLPLTVFGIIHLYMWWPFRNTATSFNGKK